MAAAPRFYLGQSAPVAKSVQFCYLFKMTSIRRARRILGKMRAAIIKSGRGGRRAAIDQTEHYGEESMRVLEGLAPRVAVPTYYITPDSPEQTDEEK
jgi:hypothetical protein